MQNATFKLIASIVLSVVTTSAICQKLPAIQTGGVVAPANIKIDGKATEWDDKFQAYNNHIEAFYTLSNNDKNLYLIVRATTHEIASKIVRGGLTLIINHTEKKNDPEAVSITYPILRGADMSAVANAYARKSFDQGDGVTTSAKQLNDVFEAKSKTIELTGIKEIADKEISVYNDVDIKAVALFDDKNALTYELAIPLKYLNLPATGEAFSYHIKVNEEPAAPMTTSGRFPPPVPVSALGTTDFWGVYKLVNKITNR